MTFFEQVCDRLDHDGKRWATTDTARMPQRQHALYLAIAFFACRPLAALAPNTLKRCVCSASWWALRHARPETPTANPFQVLNQTMQHWHTGSSLKRTV
jgi:hypothetical protein